jgi:hypothetical protein
MHDAAKLKGALRHIADLHLAELSYACAHSIIQWFDPFRRESVGSQDKPNDGSCGRSRAVGVPTNLHCRR